MGYSNKLLVFVDKANETLWGPDLPEGFDSWDLQQYGVISLGGEERDLRVDHELPDGFALLAVGCKSVKVDLRSGDLTSWHNTADDDGMVPPRIFNVEEDRHSNEPLSHDCEAIRDMGICVDSQKLVGALSLICSPFAPIGLIAADSSKHYLCGPNPELETRILEYLIPIWEKCVLSDCQESGTFAELLEINNQ